MPAAVRRVKSISVETQSEQMDTTGLAVHCAGVLVLTDSRSNRRYLAGTTGAPSGAGNGRRPVELIAKSPVP